MLVGKRRRMLRYLERTDLERYRALVADLGLRRCAMIAVGDAAPDFTVKDQDGGRGLARRLQGPQGPDRLLPARLQPGLLRPALDLPGGVKGGARRRRESTLVGLSVDSPYAHKAFQEKLGHRHDAALRLRAQGRGRQGLRLLRRRRSASPTGHAWSSSTRNGHVEPGPTSRRAPGRVPRPRHRPPAPSAPSEARPTPRGVA